MTKLLGINICSDYRSLTEIYETSEQVLQLCLSYLYMYCNAFSDV